MRRIVQTLILFLSANASASFQCLEPFFPDLGKTKSQFSNAWKAESTAMPFAGECARDWKKGGALTAPARLVGDTARSAAIGAFGEATAAVTDTPAYLTQKDEQFQDISQLEYFLTIAIGGTSLNTALLRPGADDFLLFSDDALRMSDSMIMPQGSVFQTGVNVTPRSVANEFRLIGGW